MGYRDGLVDEALSELAWRPEFSPQIKVRQAWRLPVPQHSGGHGGIPGEADCVGWPGEFHM